MPSGSRNAPVSTAASDDGLHVCSPALTHPRYVVEVDWATTTETAHGFTRPRFPPLPTCGWPKRRDSQGLLAVALHVSRNMAAMVALDVCANQHGVLLVVRVARGRVSANCTPRTSKVSFDVPPTSASAETASSTRGRYTCSRRSPSLSMASAFSRFLCPALQDVCQGSLD